MNTIKMKPTSQSLHSTQRMLMFLFGCLVVRCAFVILAARVNTKHLKYLGYLAILPAVGFMYIFLTGSRTTGVETFGEKIWWNNLRPVHSVLYILFAYQAINGHKSAWIFLALDVFIGFTSWMIHKFLPKND